MSSLRLTASTLMPTSLNKHKIHIQHTWGTVHCCCPDSRVMSGLFSLPINQWSGFSPNPSKEITGTLKSSSVSGMNCSLLFGFFVISDPLSHPLQMLPHKTPVPQPVLCMRLLVSASLSEVFHFSVGRISWPVSETGAPSR